MHDPYAKLHKSAMQTAIARMQNTLKSNSQNAKTRAYIRSLTGDKAIPERVSLVARDRRTPLASIRMAAYLDAKQRSK